MANNNALVAFVPSNNNALIAFVPNTKISFLELLTSRVESSHESKTLNFKVLFIKLEYN